MIDVIITSYLNFSNCYTGRDACAIIAIHMYMHSFILTSQKNVHIISHYRFVHSLTHRQVRTAGDCEVPH